MKNQLSNMENELPDLVNRLFREMDRLEAADLDSESFLREIDRARALCATSMNILGAGHLMAKGYDLLDGSFGKMKLPQFFGKEMTNGDKTKDPVPLLQFRGDSVSEENDKRPLLRRGNKIV
jgi:hypothetical protein